MAERLGFERGDTALTIGQAMTGLSAYAKDVSLGIIEPQPELVRKRSRKLGRRTALCRELMVLAELMGN